MTKKRKTYSQGILDPQGQPPDEGDIKIAMYTEKGNVIIDFGKDVKWLGLPPAQAMEFAGLIVRRVKEIENESASKKG